MNLGQLSMSFEQFSILNGDSISVKKFVFKFEPWQQPVTFDTYNGKPIISHDGQPLFAELCLLNLLEQQGYSGVWVDTYKNKFWTGLPSYSQPVELSGFLKETYDAIKVCNGGHRKGCWDILAAKDNKPVFIELKRAKKDAIRNTQIEWFNAAIKAGYSSADFIVAEWDFSKSN